MKAQIIERNGEPEYAVTPYADYERLIEGAELLVPTGGGETAYSCVAGTPPSDGLCTNGSGRHQPDLFHGLNRETAKAKPTCCSRCPEPWVWLWRI